MKGVVLAGGRGTRLYPVTLGVSKHLLPVYDKPLIYYPLSTLMLAGIRDILLVSSCEDLPQYQRLLGDGNHYGIRLHYAKQASPDGIAHALLIAEQFLARDRACLILGDNVFFGERLDAILQRAATHEHGALIFAYPVKDAARFAVVEIDADGRAISLEEKPHAPKSPFAVPGLYFYDGGVSERVRQLRPSARGELEITDLNNQYLAAGELQVEILERGIAWLDTGTHDSLLEASNFIRAIESCERIKVACLEEIALRRNYIGPAEVRARAEQLRSTEYGAYLATLV